MSELVVIENGKKLAGVLFLLAAFVIFGNMPRALAHGGEDHGDSQPKTTAGEK